LAYEIVFVLADKQYHTYVSVLVVHTGSYGCALHPLSEDPSQVSVPLNYVPSFQLVDIDFIKILNTITMTLCR